MNIREWRASREREETLPSGLCVKMRRDGLGALLTRGKITPGQFEQVQITDGASVISQLPTIDDLLGQVAKAVLLWPRIGEQPDEDTILLDELDLADKMAILDIVTANTQDVLR